MSERRQNLWILLVAIPAMVSFSFSCPDEADDDDDTYGEGDDDDNDAGDDDGGDDDGGDDDGSQNPPGPGDVVFTEVMHNPSHSEDLDGEWFELLNTTNENFDLAGCIVHDGVNDAHTITGMLTISGSARLVLGRNANMTVNGNVDLDYEYASISLANGDDALILTCNELEIDRIYYDGGETWPNPVGASMNLDEAFLDDNHDGSNWCEATSQIPGGGDLGTPGTPNDDCAGSDDDTGDDDDCAPPGAFGNPETGWRIQFNSVDDPTGTEKPRKGWRLKLNRDRD